jgi:hypothetical protein
VRLLSVHPHHPSSLSWLDRTFSTGSIPLRPSTASVLAWLAHDQPSIDLSGSRSEAFVRLRRNLIRRAEIEARTILGGGDPTQYVHPPVQDDQYPYWGFIPAYLGGATPDGAPLSWNGTASSCFQENSAALVPQTASGPFILLLSNSARCCRRLAEASEITRSSECGVQFELLDSLNPIQSHRLAHTAVVIGGGEGGLPRCLLAMRPHVQIACMKRRFSSLDL